MEVYKLHELTVVLSCTLSGFIMGLVYDLFRAVKTCAGQKFIWLLDLLFWVFAGAIFYLFIYFSNNASLRWYEFVFCAIGAVVYWLLASRFVFPLLYTVMRFLKTLVCAVVDVAKKILSALKKFFSPFVNQFYNKKAKTYYKAHKLFLNIRNKFQKKGKNNLKNI